ncbi:hypothetical protein V5O48_008644 [Marasmius crinis-equi]|uniref:Uncharacterized protein n=1 Tax=Marasmius crinis-equi TaxID=585013 RepID=A0ABR3FDN3_9AGAR
MSHPQRDQQSLLRQFFCRIPYPAFQNAIIPMPSLGSISNEMPLQAVADSEANPVEELDNSDTPIVRNPLIPANGDHVLGRISPFEEPHERFEDQGPAQTNSNPQTVQNLLMPVAGDVFGRTSPFEESRGQLEDQCSCQATHEAEGILIVNENIEDETERVDDVERHPIPVATGTQRASSIGPTRTTPTPRSPNPLESPVRRAGSAIVEATPRTLKNRTVIPTSNPFDHQRSRKISGKNKHTRWFAIATQGPLLSPPEPPVDFAIEDQHLFLHIDTRIVPDYLTYRNEDYDRFITIWKWLGGSWTVINLGHPRIIGGARYVLKINKSFEPAWVLPRA